MNNLLGLYLKSLMISLSHPLNAILKIKSRKWEVFPVTGVSG